MLDTQTLLALEPEITTHFARGKVDYRGQAITPPHVVRYLHAHLYRSLEVADVVVRHSDPADRVLDIGIGYGFYDILLKRHAGRDVRGLELAENIAVYCGLCLQEGIEVLPGALSADGLPMDDASVDFVILSEVFEHLRTGPLAALHEIRRVLRPGGRLLLTTPNIARLTNIVYLLMGRNIIEPLPDDARGLEHVTDEWQHIREYTLRELDGLVTRAGFRVRLRRYSHCWDRYNPHALTGTALPVRVLRATLSAITWAVPPWRSNLLLLASVPAADSQT